MANVGKRKAFSIGAEKHGVNAFSQNEIEHSECCDDDVMTSGEVSKVCKVKEFWFTLTLRFDIRHDDTKFL
ncbi:hypothetical protein AVEN_120765-1 [Araneus ventricosus]|uniref:Uncharacterized protein n=1 Tax=Araneus ventricosus TaxID=182803 RepID=A0A4Y2P035_ARAVE|nr:hypothetical protein AVEN_120765-1 [Araneus ventricosus]